MNGVTVICPNSRRCNIKVTPSTQLRKVLEEACLKQGFDVASHELKHQNHVLDLALPLRLTGLPNNATLEMVPSSHGSNIPVQIQIALQLPDGTRLVKKFLNKTNLLEVLKEFSQQSAQNLIKYDDNRVPCCAYMNKEYRGETELKATTLETMGITGGRCLIRYTAVNMSPEELSKLENRLAEESSRKKKLEKVYETRKMENERRLQLEVEREKIFEHELEKKREAEAARTHERNLEISRNVEDTIHNTPIIEPENQYVPEPVVETRRQPQTSSRLSQLQTILNQVNRSLDTNSSDFLAEELIAEDGRIHISDVNTENDQSTSALSSDSMQQAAVEKCNRMPVVIRHDPESSTTKEIVQKPSDDIDDHFFELTVNDVQSIRRDLKAQAVQGQRVLVPKTFVAEKNRKLKEESYKHTVVRFHFADKTILQAQFISREPVSRLFEFINENLINREIKFDLCLANQRLPSTDSKNLIEAGVAPKSSLYIRFHSTEKTFAANFVPNKFCEIPMAEADELSKEWLSVNGTFQPYDPKEMDTNDVRSAGKRQSGEAEDGAGPSKLRHQPAATIPKWFKKP